MGVAGALPWYGHMERRSSWTRHITPSLLISLLALFVALSGTAYAVGKVGTADLANGAVTAPKLAAGAVSTHKIRAGGVHASDLAKGAVTSAQVADGSLRLRDLGGPWQGDVQSGPLTIPADTCRLVQLGGIQHPMLAGDMVVGRLVGPGEEGAAVLDNHGVVLPTMVSETTAGDPGEALFDLMVCDVGGSGQTIPAGSQLQYQVIGR